MNWVGKVKGKMTVSLRDRLGGGIMTCGFGGQWKTIKRGKDEA